MLRNEYNLKKHVLKLKTPTLNRIWLISQGCCLATKQYQLRVIIAVFKLLLIALFMLMSVSLVLIL